MRNSTVKILLDYAEITELELIMITLDNFIMSGTP
jgi:hypothetical protein